MMKYLLSFLLLPTLTFASSKLDLHRLFHGAPIIYSILGFLLIFSFICWFYSLLTWKKNTLIPKDFVLHLSKQLYSGDYEQAQALCRREENLIAPLMHAALLVRQSGPNLILEIIHAEGKRAGITLWKRVSLFNDIAVVAPMLGLLGTVLGMFFAFYDMNSSVDSLTTIFDGLGVAIGTTVAGLIVAIISMLFHTILKYRVTSLLTDLEKEAFSLAQLMKERS